MMTQAATPSRPPIQKVRAPSTAPWTFLTNHAHVLIHIAGNPDARIRDVAAEVGITERAVQRIIPELEADGYLRHKREGRRNRYYVISDRPLRHPIEGHRNVAELIGLILSDEKSV